MNSMSDLFHAQGAARLRPRRLRRHGGDAAAHVPGAHEAAPRLREDRRQAGLARQPLDGCVASRTPTHLDRVDDLRAVPAAVRFLSCEPLLGPLPGLDLDGHRLGHRRWRVRAEARPLDPDWVRDIRDQCIDAGVAFFFKQWGGRTPKANGRELEGRTWDEMPHLAGAVTA